MIKTLSIPYYQLPQFKGCVSVTKETLTHHTRREVTAPCGCVWHGLVGRVGAGVSDGIVTLCDTHAILEEED